MHLRQGRIADIQGIQDENRLLCISFRNALLECRAENISCGHDACLVIAFDKPAVSIYVILTMGALTLIKREIPWKAYIHFMTVASCLYGFQRRGDCRGIWPRAFGRLESSGPFFWICLYQENLVLAAGVFLKAMAGIGALYMMSLTAGQRTGSGASEASPLPPCWLN